MNIDDYTSITTDYMDKTYKGWRKPKRSIYKMMIQNNDLKAIEFSYTQMIYKLPKDYIACDACELDNDLIFSWSILDITNYKMVALSALHNRRLSFLQQIENEIFKIDDMINIIRNVSTCNNYTEILEWISSIQ